MSEPLELITTAAAPRAIGPYTQAIRVGGWVFASGQIPLDPASGEITSHEFGPQVERALANLKAVLEAAGCPLARVVKVTAYLTDLKRFAEFNEIYSRFFGGHKPARAVIGAAALPRDAQIELEAVAAP
jgi:2-iminobutanoate/2-iminopropanoate deaminase